MEQSDRPLTRDALVSMQVIDAKGRLIGRVKDVSFEIGRLGISISVEKSDGSVEHISWDAVQAATDFILLKPQVTGSSPIPTATASSATRSTTMSNLR